MIFCSTVVLLVGRGDQNQKLDQQCFQFVGHHDDHVSNNIVNDDYNTDYYEYPKNNFE